jgi:hypothetical protein
VSCIAKKAMMLSNCRSGNSSFSARKVVSIWSHPLICLSVSLNRYWQVLLKPFGMVSGHVARHRRPTGLIHQAFQNPGTLL